LPILIESLLLAIQMGSYTPKFTLPITNLSENQIEVEKVETISYITKPIVVDTQITPDPPPKIRGNHKFPWGWCTYYVAQRREIPWGGNAITWLTQAQKYGYEISQTPQEGAIVVTKESKMGHVAYVESVSGDTITISEMNYFGFGVVSHRTISTNYWAIKGYIYS